MNEPVRSDLKIDLRQAHDAWHVVVVRDGRHHEFASIAEAIRYLERVAGASDRPSRGLR